MPIEETTYTTQINYKNQSCSKNRSVPIPPNPLPHYMT